MTRAFVFPGQGSQRVGMGVPLAEAFPAARRVFEEVDDALSQHLSRLIFEGPEAELTLTQNAQPALLAVAYATVRVVETEGSTTLPRNGAFVAGHSLGEYTAIMAVGGFSLAEAVRLVRRRGMAMQEAVPVGVGAMAALLGLGIETAEAIASEATDGEICAVANDNAPDQVVISGHSAAVDRALPLARERGAKRCVPLPVSAPFHCRLMAPAAKTMAEFLAKAEIRPLQAPLVANVTAEKVTEPETVRRLLVEQITGRVRWRESVIFMKSAGVDTLVELGPGKVLSRMVRRIDSDLTGVAVETPEDVETFLKSL